MHRQIVKKIAEKERETKKKQGERMVAEVGDSSDSNNS
jgi:hypothetical protein